MNDKQVMQLINGLKAHADPGVKGISDVLGKHILDLRHVLGELAVGLDDEELNEQVEEVLGWDTDKYNLEVEGD
jgi:hypothetical protein